MFKKNQKGFTLIELLIVVAIIAILAAIAIPQFGAYRARAVRASMVADSKNIATAIESLFQDCNTYGVVSGFSGGPAAGSYALGTAGNCTANTGITIPNVNISKGNTVAITSATTSGWTMTVTNTAGNDSTFTGPITRNNLGACSWSSGGSC